MKTSTNTRIFGAFALVIQIMMILVYGFHGHYFHYDKTKQPDQAFQQFLVQYIFTAIFTIIGFGMLLSSKKHSLWSGLALSLLIVSLNVQLSFLLQKFWFNILQALRPDFRGYDYPFSQRFFRIMKQDHVNVSVQTMRIALMSSISLLVSFTGFIGRFKILQALIMTTIFNIGWNFSLYLNISVNIRQSPSFGQTTKMTLFDDFGTCNIYIFGSIFGSVMSGFLRPTNQAKEKEEEDNKEKEEENNKENNPKNASLIGLAGTGFIFATFAMTGKIYFQRSQFSDSIGFMNVIFSMSSSLIGTYIMSAIFRKGNIGLTEALLGTISGGVIVGGIAQSLTNVAASIAVGFFAGLLTGFWYGVCDRFLNRNRMDRLGIFGTFLIMSLFGGFVVSPVTTYLLLKNDIVIQGSIDPFNPIQQLLLHDRSPQGILYYTIPALQIYYALISVACALISALVAGIICYCIGKGNQEIFDRDNMLFNQDEFGLYSSGQNSSNNGRNLQEPQNPNAQTDGEFKRPQQHQNKQSSNQSHQ